MLSRTLPIQQQAGLTLGRWLTYRSLSCAQKRLLSKRSLARPHLAGSFGTCHSRSINIKSAVDAKPQGQAYGPASQIQRPDALSQLHDLVDDVAAAFEKTESAALGRWADRLRMVSARRHAEPQIGVLYSDTACLSSVGAVRAADSGSGQRASFMSLSAAKGNVEAFADWLFSCDHVVVVAGRKGIVQALALSEPSVAALQLHPDTAILVDGLEESGSAADAFSGLLLETLQLLGIASANTGGKQCLVKPESDLESLLHSELSGHRRSDDANSRLLASAVEAAMLCAECGGKSALPSFASALPVSNRQSADLATSRQRNVVYSVAEASRGMQRDFESGDLTTVDASIGEVKHRTSKWFASGRIWQALLMRVYETADDLIDNAVLDRCFEAAELGMVHAAGRLNESIRRVAADLAAGIDLYARQASATELVDPAVVGSTVDMLRAIACQADSVDQFALARQVWDARKQMIESDVLEGIPRHIHWSLAQFWAIQAAALSGAATSFAYFDVPLQYAGSGGLGISLLAFIWLGRRWNLLERTVLDHLDSQADRLRQNVVRVHKNIIQTKLETPVLGCVQTSPSALAQQTTDADHIISAATISQWRLQLGSTRP